MLRKLQNLLRRVFGAISERVSDVALEWAAERVLIPTAMGSAEFRDRTERELRNRAVFGARVTQADYLQELRDGVDLLLSGGTGNDLPAIRLGLKEQLRRLEYTPETGFPGDLDLGIEPANPGSLRDLSSDRRVMLMLETQVRLARGASQRMRGLEPGRLARWPAWELVRVLSRRVPRGSEGSGSEGWAGRWLRAGGPMLANGRLMALKTDPVWEELGNPELFDDAIDAGTPPFAYQSGMGWREVSRDEAIAVGLLTEEGAIGDATLSDRPLAPAMVERARGLEIPVPQASTRGLDPDLRAELVRQVRARRAEKPDWIRAGEGLADEVRRANADYLRRNPDLAGLLGLG